MSEVSQTISCMIHNQSHMWHSGQQRPSWNILSGQCKSPQNNSMSNNHLSYIQLYHGSCSGKQIIGLVTWKRSSASRPPPVVLFSMSTKIYYSRYIFELSLVMMWTCASSRNLLQLRQRQPTLSGGHRVGASSEGPNGGGSEGGRTRAI